MTSEENRLVDRMIDGPASPERKKEMRALFSALLQKTKRRWWDDIVND